MTVVACLHASGLSRHADTSKDSSRPPTYIETKNTADSKRMSLQHI
ncbi:MAG: hypothetical protein IIV50_04950 [Muribaculaceae bacterium]|nr:hypothetical protein [Muribaculaceae bacterium]